MMGVGLITRGFGNSKSMELPLNVGLTPFIVTLSKTDSTVAVMFWESKGPPTAVSIGKGGAFGLSDNTILGSLPAIFWLRSASGSTICASLLINYYNAPRYTSTISVTQIPSCQWFDEISSITHWSCSTVVGTVAGMSIPIPSTLKFTVIRRLRQAGICKDRTLKPKDTEVDSDVLSEFDALVELPVFSEVDVPLFSEVEDPVFSEVELLTLEDVEEPELSEVELPELSEIEWLELSEEELPEVSDEEAPELAEVELPELCDVEEPELDEVELPELFDVEEPVLEEVELPELSDVEEPLLLEKLLPELLLELPPEEIDSEVALESIFLAESMATPLSSVALSLCVKLSEELEEPLLPAEDW